MNPRELRTELMKWILAESGGNSFKIIPTSPFLDLVAHAGVTEELVEGPIRYLEDKGLIKALWTYDEGLPEVQITAFGIDAAEDAEQRPEVSTEYFSPWSTTINNNINIGGSVIGGQVMNASPGAAQHAVMDPTVTFEQIRDFIGAGRLLIDAVDLGASERADVIADLDSLSRELERPAPRRHRLAELGKTVRNVLEQAVAALAATELAPHVHQAIDVLGSVDWTRVG